MSKSSNMRRTIGLLFVFVACVALVCADLVVSAARSPQNSNSSEPQDETTRGAMMTSNSNSGNTNSGKSSRRRSRRNRSKASANANMSGDTGNANMSGDMSAGGQDANANMSGDASMTANTNTGRRRGRRRGRRNRPAATDTSGAMDANANMSGGTNSGGMMSSDGGTQTDLSGTYTGTVNYPEGGLNGPATIVVTGNQFTLTPDGGGAAVNGTVTAVTTRGYTGVTMMFGDRTQIPPSQSPPPLPAVSLRARMSGGRVTLMSVPGEKRQFSFAATGASGTGRVRTRSKRRMRNRAARATSTDTDRGMDGGTAIKPPTKTP